jgi:hypothetical protein
VIWVDKCSQGYTFAVCVCDRNGNGRNCFVFDYGVGRAIGMAVNFYVMRPEAAADAIFYQHSYCVLAAIRPSSQSILRFFD